MKYDSSRFFLRFAITPNCNFRCEYCNPNGATESTGILKDSEILQIMQAGINAGINRVHWTGGEPTLRNMKQFIRGSRGGIDEFLIRAKNKKLALRVRKIKKAILAKSQ